jgi:hypothetical protein
VSVSIRTTLHAGEAQPIDLFEESVCKDAVAAIFTKVRAFLRCRDNSVTHWIVCVRLSSYDQVVSMAARWVRRRK